LVFIEHMYIFSWNYIKEKWAHAGFQRYFQNTGWMFIGQVSMVVSLFVNIWIARYLGPTNYGTLSYVFAFVGLFSFIAGLGLNDILVRDLVNHPEKRDELLGTAFGLLSAGSFIAFLCVVIASFWLEPSHVVRPLIIVYGATFLFSPVSVISAYFQATVQAKKNAMAQMIGVISVAVIKIILILLGKGIIWLTFAFVLDYVAGAILYTINYRASKLSIRRWSFNMKMAQKLFSVSVFLMLSGVASYLFLRIDQVMIKFYLGDAAVGLYAAAVKLSEIWYFVPGIVCGSLFPAIINAKKSGEAIYKNRLKKLYIFLGGGAFCIALPTAILAPWLIKIMFGGAYAAAVPILQIYIWSGIGLFLDTGLDRYFTNENRLKLIFGYNLLAAATNIILNIILIPRIGLTGAAWATLISYSIYPLCAFTIHMKNLYSKPQTV